MLVEPVLLDLFPAALAILAAVQRPERLDAVRGGITAVFPQRRMVERHEIEIGRRRRQQVTPVLRRAPDGRLRLATHVDRQRPLQRFRRHVDIAELEGLAFVGERAVTPRADRIDSASSTRVPRSVVRHAEHVELFHAIAGGDAEIEPAAGDDSTTAASSATRRGWCSGSSRISVPMRTRIVFAATAARKATRTEIAVLGEMVLGGPDRIVAEGFRRHDLVEGGGVQLRRGPLPLRRVAQVIPEAESHAAEPGTCAVVLNRLSVIDATALPSQSFHALRHSSRDFMTSSPRGAPLRP